MKNKVLRAINDYDMLSMGTSVVVGVSGGADSMALLHFLNSIKYDKKLNIIAVHVNHCLRGSESIRDENFVREYCKNNNIDIEVLVVDVKERALLEKIGTEECARNVRYDFFNKIAKDHNAKIATAHTLSDSFETIIFNLTRGTGINGLCGIPAVRGNIIRPFIYVTRKETEDYCNKNSISYVTDSTNLKRDYSRNKIRLDVVPVLKDINCSVENNILNMIDELSCDARYMDIKADEALNSIKYDDLYDLEKLKELHPAIRSRVIRKIARNFANVNLEKIHVDLISKIMDDGHGAVNIPNGYTVCVNNKALKISKLCYDKHDSKKNKDIKILTDYKQKSIIEVITIDEFYDRLKRNNNLYNFAIDFKVVDNNTQLRKRKEGDKFNQAGRNLTKKLKKLFNESKIPVDKRDEISIISNGDDILWIEGFGASEKARVSKDTEEVMIILLGEC